MAIVLFKLSFSQNIKNNDFHQTMQEGNMNLTCMSVHLWVSCSSHIFKNDWFIRKIGVSNKYATVLRLIYYILIRRIQYNYNKSIETSNFPNLKIKFINYDQKVNQKYKRPRTIYHDPRWLDTTCLLLNIPNLFDRLPISNLAMYIWTVLSL